MRQQPFHPVHSFITGFVGDDSGIPLSNVLRSTVQKFVLFYHFQFRSDSGGGRSVFAGRLLIKYGFISFCYRICRWRTRRALQMYSLPSCITRSSSVILWPQVSVKDGSSTCFNLFVFNRKFSSYFTLFSDSTCSNYLPSVVSQVMK